MASANDPSPAPEPSDELSGGLPSYPAGIHALPPRPPDEEPPPAAQGPARSTAPKALTIPRSSLSPEQIARISSRLDSALVILVALFTFLMGCFAIRNSDFLMHLATGRFLWESVTQGKLGNLFGYEPFAHTTQDIHWVNHSWLLDLLLYGLYGLLGGSGLVVLKAAMGAVLAGVLLQIHRAGRSRWIPAACTALAVLALSPRFLFQPAAVSFLFLGVTLYLLARRETMAERSSRRGLWLLPPLFVLWVNIDSWFLLGPLTVGLYLLGEVLQEQFGPRREGLDLPPADERRTLALVLVVGVAACVLNPHHVRAFALPPQLALSGAALLLKHDTLFQPAYVSPLESAYFQERIGLSAAGLSYFVLVALSLGSFGLNGGPTAPASRTGWRWWRALIWLAFFLLSLYHARAIPFFAVVAGPIAALNLQDFAARTWGLAARAEGPWPLWSLGGRAVTVLAVLALTILSWPGWLQAAPREGRRVSWGLIVEPSLEKTAATLRQWRSEGKLGDGDRCLNLTPDVANYFAWFCPEEKGFLDHRLQPFPQAAADFVAVRQGLTPAPATEHEDPDLGPVPRPDARSDESWQKVLRARGVNHLILTRPPQRTLRRMLGDPAQWTLLYLDGRTVIMGWTDPAGKERDRFRALRYDPDRLAFGPSAVQAPPERPDRPAQAAPREWWERFLQGPEPRPLASDESEILVQYFAWQGPEQERGNLALWRYGFAAGLVGVGAPAPGLGATPSLLAYRLSLAELYYEPPPGQARPKSSPAAEALAGDHFNQFRLSQDDGPPGAAWLAVRAGRSGLHQNASEPIGHLRLFLAYALLHHHTRERAWMNRMPLLRGIRQVQMIGCLKQALAMEADLEPANARLAHMALADLYRDMRFFDLSLKHRSEELRLTRQVGPMAQETADQYGERLARLEQDHGLLSDGVKKNRDEFIVGSARESIPLRKVEIARRMGLPNEAFKVLEPRLDKLQREEAQVALELMVQMGEIDWVRRQLTDSFESMDPVPIAWHLLPSYDWFQVLLAAASGDYRQADLFLERIEKWFGGMKLEPTLTMLLKRPDALSIFTPNPPEMPGVLPLPALIEARLMREQAALTLAQFPFGRVQQSDLKTLRGLLALEQGDTEQAKERFREAIDLAPTPDFPSHPAAAYYLRLLE